MSAVVPTASSETAILREEYGYATKNITFCRWFKDGMYGRQISHGRLVQLGKITAHPWLCDIFLQ